MSILVFGAIGIWLATLYLNHPNEDSISTPETATKQPAKKSDGPAVETSSEEPSKKEDVSLPANWAGAQVLASNEKSAGNDHVFNRSTVVRQDDFPYPVLIEEKLIRDPVTAVEKVISRSEMVADHLLLKLKPGHDTGVLAGLLSGLGATLRAHPSAPNLYFLELPDFQSDTLAKALEKLRKPPSSVAYAEPDYIVHAFANIPNDARFGEQWGLNNTGQTGGAADADIDAPEGWDINNDASGIVVGVVDTGARYTHEDLAANMWQNTNEIPGNGTDDDSNGFIDDQFGINALNNSGDPFDDSVSGHGTHVSGTVGAVGNNGVGVAGVAWRVQIMALKFLSSQGSGTVSGAIQCIDYGRVHGANILSNSWGGGGFSLALDNAIERAQTAGIIFVAAAGNDATDNDAFPAYPATYPRDNIVSVASMTDSEALSSFSNFGEGSVDIAAPGSSILSVGKASDTAYATLSGTSMACPHISGLLAILMAQFPAEDYLTLIDRLYGGSDTIPAYAGKTRTGKRANLFGSLSLASVIAYPKIVTGIGNPIVTVGTSVTLAVDATGGGTLTYQWLKNGAVIPGEVGNTLLIGSAAQADVARYQVIVGNTAGETSNTGNLEIGATNPAFNAAVGAATLPFFTSGSALWIVDSEEGQSDSESLSSGAITDDQQSRLQTTVTGPGTISFWWKVSSENNFDFLQFFIGGQLADRISDEKDWEEVLFSVPAGTQTLEWNYTKDFSISTASDRGWVDDIQFIDAGIKEPFIFNHPVSVSHLEGDSITLLVESFGEAILLYQWEKDGVPIPGAEAQEYTIASALKSDAGRYRAVVTNGSGSDTSNEAVVDVFGSDPIGEALDFPDRTWNQGGSAFWIPQSIEQHDGVDALRSGELNDLEQSAFSFSIDGPVDLAFQWKSSTETYYDFLTVYIDGVPQAGIAGKRDWHRQLLRIPSGESHNVRWIYEKDFLVFGGEDTVWVDELAIVDVDAIYNEAVETGGDNLVWSMENTSWFTQSIQTQDGQDALQSGPTTRADNSAIETTIAGPATVSFWWKVSSEFSADFLKFRLDGGALLLTTSGEQSWSQRIIYVDSGSHTLAWSYEKNSTLDIGEDAGWLDLLEIVYPPQTVEEWRLLHFDEADLLVADKKDTLWGDLADPDNDFLPNLVEAYMGLDPNVNDKATPNALEFSSDADFLRFVYQRVKTTPGLTGTIEWSTNGVNWSSQDVVVQILTDLPTTEIVEAKVPIGARTNLMARLRVSR